MSRPFDRVLYGLRQPFIGAQILFRHPSLLEAALFPVACLAGLCGFYAWVSDGAFIRNFYASFAALAPVPSFLFADYYAKMAADAHRRLGHGEVEPLIEGIGGAVRRIVARAALLAIALVPLRVVKIVPLAGATVFAIIAAAWALHWVVLDAFDTARVLRPGETIEMREAAIEKMPKPWFVRALVAAAAHLPLSSLLLRFAAMLDWLAKPWRDEMALVERHPMMLLGFALATIVLLTIPVLNVLFRPIILVAATVVTAELRARVEVPLAA